MHVTLAIYLWAIVLDSVSAGGVYCAKTARARAAALGLDYPGVHGAPGLFGAAHHGMPPHDTLIGAHPYEHNDNPGEAESEANTAYHGPNRPKERSLGDWTHGQVFPRGSESTPFLLNHGSYDPVQRERSTKQLLSLPRGYFVSNREPNFEQVKHVAPLTKANAPGQFDLVNMGPQGRNEPSLFVYNEHDLVVGESVPIRHDMSPGGFSQPQSRGHGVYQRGPVQAGRGPEKRGGPAFGSSLFSQKGHISAMTGQGPAGGKWSRISFPGHTAHSLLRGLDIKQFVPGNTALGRLIKPLSDPTRLSQRVHFPSRPRASLPALSNHASIKHSQH